MNTDAWNREGHSAGDISDQAGYWDARLRAPDCTDEDRARFAEWRAASAAHRDAFERLQNFVAALRSGAGRADVRGLRDAATMVVCRSQRRFGWAASACAAAALVIAAGAGWWLLPKSVRLAPSRALAAIQGVDFYETGVGQRSTVALEDGSSVELNARTRIEVDFDESRRIVRLIEGQALFSVARDPRRQFIVRAADRSIMAIGTRFDVRLDESSVRITLLEGRVNVDRDGAARSRLQPLVPGEQLVALLAETPAEEAARRPEAVRPVDVGKVVSWRDGQVYLEDLTLAEAVAEMNRYSRIQISISDDSLAQLRVNGMFRAGEQQAFLTALQEYFPIATERSGETEIALVSRR